MYELKEDEFLLCTLAYPAVEYNKVKTLLEDCGIETRIEHTNIEIRTYTRNPKTFNKAAYRNVISLADFEKAKKIGYGICKNSFLRETNPSKYSRYNALMKAYERALRVIELKIPKTKMVP